MQWTITGLGNPGKEYVGTRHNVGREFLMSLEKKLPPKTKVVLPDTYMNNSGKAFTKLFSLKADASVGSPTASRRGKIAEQLVVLHDDLDLPLGGVKISFGSGSGGHKGVESIQKTLKTKDFVRIRIGISPATPSGKLKKPSSEKVNDFVLGKFRAPEQEKLKKVRKAVAEALEILLESGREQATMYVNSRR